MGETGFHDRRIGGSVRCEPPAHRGINGHASVSIGRDRSQNDPGLSGITDQLDHEGISDACLSYNNLLEPQCDRGHPVIRDVNKNGLFDADLIAARVEGVSRRHGHLSALGSGTAHFKTGHDAPPVEHPVVSTGLGKEIGLFLIEVVVTHEHPEEVANALTTAVIVGWATSEVHGSAPRRDRGVQVWPGSGNGASPHPPTGPRGPLDYCQHSVIKLWQIEDGVAHINGRIPAAVRGLTEET